MVSKAVRTYILDLLEKKLPYREIVEKVKKEKNETISLGGITYIKNQDLTKQDREHTKQLKNKKNNQVKKKLLPLPDTCDFFTFCRWFSFPYYKGLYNWQKEHERLTKKAKYEMTLVGRDHGKSIKYGNKYQYRMWYKGYDILLLGWTDRRKQIALYVYTFFNERGLIKQDKRTSPFHFTTTKGTKFDCYLITGKEALGMHSEGKQDRFKDLTPEEIEELKQLYDGELEDGIFDDKALQEFIKARDLDHKLWISIDDPIDISFMKERWKEKELELRFQSTLYSINPDKWSFTGTHKFEGDIFDFWKAMFGDKLVIYIQEPILPDGSLLCPERFTHPTLLTYKQDLLDGKKDLDEIRRHIGEYAYQSEWCQNPHPVIGQVWDHVKLVFNIKPMKSYDLFYIYIDRATTVKESSDYTGCPMGLREIGTGKRLIIDDFTGNITLEDLLILVNDYIIDFHAKYEKVIRRIYIIVEKQGGGDDFVISAKNRRFFYKDGKAIENKIPELAIIIEVHSTGEKLKRIEDRLRAPLINERIEFLYRVKNSNVVNEILTFPNCYKFDGIDALATGDFEIMNIPITEFGDPIKELEIAYERIEREEEREQARSKNANTRHFERGEAELVSKYKKRVVFS